MLPDWMRDAVIERLAQLPEGNAICHGDFHPDNVIMSDRGPVIIDWSDATRCSPMYDVARTWFLLRMSAVPEYVRARWLVNLLRRGFHQVYLKHYRRLCPFSEVETIAWRLPVVAARLAEGIPEERQRQLDYIDAALSPGNI